MPLVPSSNLAEVEPEQLRVLLLDYTIDFSVAKLERIFRWTEENPSSKWAPSLFLNCGNTYYDLGYYTKAMKAWDSGWKVGRGFTSPKARVIADACFGELVRMHARIGNMGELETLFAELGNRQLVGPGAVVASHAKEGLGVMKTRPGVAFKCGPFALASVRKALNIPDAMHKTIVDAQSTSAGFSLHEICGLSQALEMDCIPVRAALPLAEVPVPSVIHWKLGHYAALVEQRSGKFHVIDPTFGSDSWVSKEAVDAEASGYFIIQESQITSALERVPLDIASQVRGKGFTEKCNQRATTKCDKTAGGTGGCEACKRCPSPSTASSTAASRLMPKYTMHAMLASLSIYDTPVGYAPAYGPPVYFNMTYNHREYGQPPIFGYSNLGHGWSFDWLSSVVDDPANIGSDVTVYMPGGGSVQFTGWDSNTNTYTKRDIGTDLLKVVSTNPIKYELLKSDGSRHVYTLVENSVGAARTILMTSTEDAFGHSLTYNYDTQFRLTTVTDEQTRQTTICYNTTCGSSTDNKIWKVTDPYGRSATLGYDSQDRLNSITDNLNMTTTFVYDSSNFITEMQTPYGTTSFAQGEQLQPDGVGGYNVVGRWIETKDPLGDKERVEYVAVNSIPRYLDTSEVPQHNDFYVRNDWADARNSFYWSKSAMKSGHCTYDDAELFHFVHEPDQIHTGRILEWGKKPLESYVFYNYPGSGSATIRQDSNLPNKIARRLDDGSTQLIRVEYNDKGNITSYTDPAERKTLFEYDSATGFDLEYVKQVTSIGNVVLKQIVRNAAGLPETVTDASGADTTILYNTKGQPTSITNDKNEIVSFDYTTTGLLERQISNNPNSYVEYSYDAYDRVASATVFPDDYTLRFEYDLGDRLTKVTYPDNTFEQQVWDKLDIVASRDRMGGWTQARYSLLGQLESVTDPAGNTIQYAWCACGSPSRIVDANGNITMRVMDVAGRLVKEIAPDNSTTTYVYEPKSGRLSTKTDPKGQVTNYTYNIDDTIAKVAITNVAAGTAAVPDVEYDWDAKFRRLDGWTDGLGYSDIEYVPYNNADTVYGDGKVDTIDGPWSNDVMDYNYDQLGRRIGQSMGGTAWFSNVTYDSFGRLQTTTNNLGSFTNNYVPNTSRLSYVAGPYWDMTFSYAPKLEDFRLSEIDHYDFSQGSGRNFSYEQDVLGRITEWEQLKYESFSSDTFAFEYDAADRLIEWFQFDASNGDKIRLNWRIDPAGNRVNEQVEDILNGTVARHEYMVNDADEVTDVDSGGPLYVKGSLNEQGTVNTGLSPAKVSTQANGSFSAWIATNSLGSANFSAEDFNSNTSNASATVTPVDLSAYDFQYDANGNMTSMLETEPDGITTHLTTYEWDALNQLVVINSGTHRSEFTYDGMGRRVRVKEIENSVTTSDRFVLWNGLTIIASGLYSTLGITTADMTYFPQGYFQSGDKSYYMKDHLGSVRAIFQNKDGVVGSYDYDAYGNLVNSPLGPKDPEFLYSGHFYHRPSGLYLAPYRAYDPRLGRWLSEEPLGLDGPNLYHYVFNNPLNSVDITGLQMYMPGGPTPDDPDGDGLYGDFDPNPSVPYGNNEPYDFIPPGMKTALCLGAANGAATNYYNGPWRMLFGAVVGKTFACFLYINANPDWDEGYEFDTDKFPRLNGEPHSNGF